MLLSPQYTENQIMQMGDDWDLQAVVRGCCSSSSTAASPSIMDDSFFYLPDWGFEEPDNTTTTTTTTTNNNNMFCFPDLSETKTAIEELEQLCKPFLPRFELPISPLCNPAPTLQQLKTEHQQQQQQQHQPRRSISHRPKRRKNQQKKVVRQVPAEGLSSDMWAWRKYGQKPIKGSPYPRGYYRCSSSKGCLARKQVERSRVDPQMFIVTYTAEHNHPVPTHRNSLAGSTRHKVVSSSSLKVPSTTSPPPMGSSPLTPSTEEDDEHIIKQEEGEVEEDDDDDLGLSKLQELMSDDLFMELDQLVGDTSTPPASDPPVSTFDDCFVSPHWFSPATSATAAGCGLISSSTHTF